MNCLTCTHSQITEANAPGMEGEIIAECHRFPPQVFVLNGEVTQAYPSVTNNDICGEWQGE